MPKKDPACDWPVRPELRVSDPAAVELLWHQSKRIHLRPFLGRSCGLAEAAAMLGVQKTAMSYWIKRLLALGLIRPRGTETRGGRQVPVYRCVADRLLLRLKDAPHASYEAVCEDTSALWRQATTRALARSIERQAPWLDLSIQAGDAAGMGIVLAAHGAGAPLDDSLHYWGRFWLTADEAAALRNELDALWDRYAALSDRTSKSARTLVHLVTVPDAPASTG
jgi:predicted transcriptional regulator